MQKLQGTNRRVRRTTVDIGNADMKLRQADFFLSHLEAAPRQIAKSLARATPDQSEILHYYFSACLSAAQSVFYTLEKAAKPRFTDIESAWRKNQANDQERARFNRMIRIRDDDVHFGESGAEPLPAAIPAEPSEFQNYVHHNSALHGPAATSKRTNPDGTEVTAAVLRGTRRLYIQLNGQRVDATTACREFIGQLRSLQAAVAAALVA